jgi:hypothetical protein
MFDAIVLPQLLRHASLASALMFPPTLASLARRQAIAQGATQQPLIVERV